MNPGDRVTDTRTYLSEHDTDTAAADAVGQLNRHEPGVTYGIEQYDRRYLVVRVDRVVTPRGVPHAACESGPRDAA